MTDFLDDDDDNDETEVERPKPKAKPAPPPPPPPVINVPDEPERGRGSSGGSMDPRDLQAQNDREVQFAFGQQRMGKVIPIRPGPERPAAAPPRPAAPVSASGGGEVAGRPSEASRGHVGASPAVQAAHREAYEARLRAQKAAEIEAEVLEGLEDEPEPERRVPVRRRTSPMVLLGVAAAALFGAVAFSMLITKQPEEKNDDDDEGFEPIDLTEEEETPPKKEEDIIEGEIVEDENVA